MEEFKLNFADRHMRRIAIFLDGTWNETGDNTNVWRVKSLCSPVDEQGVEQVTYYDVGVNGLLGGTFGKGLIKNVLDAYSWLIGHYAPGDEIYIFGFSRGAYTARSLAGFIARYGLLIPGAPIGISQLYADYQNEESRKTIWSLRQDRDRRTLKNPSIEEQWMLSYCMPVNIKMVGVWDTVGALGVPKLPIPGIGSKTLKFIDTGLRKPIEHGFHAVAIDEHRKKFAPTLWTVRQDPDDQNFKAEDVRSLLSVQQRWFVGAHANIGGGYHSDLLAQAPLNWIVNEATRLGLHFRYPVDIHDGIYNADIVDSHRFFMGGAYSIFSRRHFRPIGAKPQEDSRGLHHTINETIDVSVFERYSRDSAYRPRNLTDWGKRHMVKIEALTSSVLASNPHETAPTSILLKKAPN